MTGASWSGEAALHASQHALRTVVLDTSDVRLVLSTGEEPLSLPTVMNWINRGRRGIRLAAARTGDGVRAPYGFNPLEVVTFAKFALERAPQWHLLPGWLQERVWAVLDGSTGRSMSSFDAGAAFAELRATLGTDTTNASNVDMSNVDAPNRKGVTP